ncbi:glycosyltransferase family 2 protein [Fructobacillus sp. M1-13]|uniref:Glycosyltransferase family 2 protein n=1 Tax=Fructobacillus papyriferae TaxID=2713171 RepID=A0ABS5QQ11_9LACO|nr:glycosyltransferase family 2 protein [Fructobacillus papyriferae]MBS9335273.1 glycosyltransferase family 2 protein [Fructobacillus papyriferae]MCD2159058.1 glycosyltransferase family 2 protein [Fructobacillus papyriferae]
MENVRNKAAKLAFILPAYNEEEMLAQTVTILTNIKKQLIQAKKIATDSFILIVDDGSTDHTADLMAQMEQETSDILTVQLSRNFGHQKALLAGLTEAIRLADITVTLDADLQDNPTIIESMVDQYLTGSDIVYAVRSSREQDSWFKKNSALAFYRTAAWLGVELVFNHADFRLMSKRAVKALLAMPERNLFLRAMVPLVGYPSSKVYYERKKREAGSSKYPLKKMLAFAIDGITSFSVKPIKLLFNLGLAVSSIAFFEIAYTILEKIIGHPTAGWSSLMIFIWLLGGLNLMAISVIGTYVGKVFTEVKARPTFVIQEKSQRLTQAEERKAEIVPLVCQTTTGESGIASFSSQYRNSFYHPEFQ